MVGYKVKYIVEQRFRSFNGFFWVCMNFIPVQQYPIGILHINADFISLDIKLYN